MTLDEIQAELAVWTLKNFGPPVFPYHRPLLGAMEELGELAHSHLKKEQGIRGAAADHDAAARDAIGDTIIYLLDYCTNQGWNLQQILAETWQQVKARDWTKDPVGGGA